MGLGEEMGEGEHSDLPVTLWQSQRWKQKGSWDALGGHGLVSLDNLSHFSLGHFQVVILRS